MMALFELPFTPDTPAPATWTAALGQADSLIRRMTLQLERERVDKAMARVAAILRASTAERQRMAQACKDPSAPQVRLKLRQDHVSATHARGWILAEMREQLELLIMKDSIAELGEASPFYNDLNWRRIGHRASEERLAELRERLKDTEPRKRTRSAAPRARRKRADDGEEYERIGEIYERYENSERKTARTKEAPVPEAAAPVEPACAALQPPTRQDAHDDGAENSQPLPSPTGAPESFDRGLPGLGRGPESQRPTGAMAMFARSLGLVLHSLARTPSRKRQPVVSSVSGRARRHATRAAKYQAGPGGTCLRSAA